MTFYEWFDKTFYEDKFKSIARDAWKAAQEDMRERAVNVALDAFNHSLNGDEIADEIRALPIEV